MNEQKDTDQLMGDLSRKMWVSVLKQHLIPPSDVRNGLLGLAIVWSTLFIVKSPELALGAEGILPSWIFSAEFVHAMLGISGLAVLVMSFKSLLPAVLLLVAGVVMSLMGVGATIYLGAYLASCAASVVYIKSPYSA